MNDSRINAQKSAVTVVSGLPRSGTSLMMQILKAAGCSIFSDNTRTADTDNPKGYYESEKAKRLISDSSWIAETRGHVLKVISLLLYYLPSSENYRIIFMTRNMTEILVSQKEMLHRRGEVTTVTDDAMKLHYEKHLQKMREWLTSQRNMSVMYCDYNRLVVEPRETLEKVVAFLGNNMNFDDMLKVVDPALYRQRYQT
ncbi:MAG: sulfotransferase [Lentisphaerae bacterium]|nr:sulfotransferase [Lentisphaerota bacterium]